MASKREKRARRGRHKTETADYTDAEGGVLTLRCELSTGTIRKLSKAEGSAAATTDDLWHRRKELLFERLAVSWTIAGMPIRDQKMLLGRYRMASAEEQRWVDRTLEAHLDAHIPELR